MADQPATPPAADPTNPQVPGQQPVTPPADANPAAQSISFDSFSEEEKKYLAGQGITKQEELTTDALRKVINHSQAAQKTAQERQAELDKLKPLVPQVPGQVPTQPLPAPANPNDPAAPTATPPQNPAQPAAPQAVTLDSVTAFTLSTSLATQHPALKDELMSGKLYADMQTLGIPLVANGQVNINGLATYAQNRAKQVELEAQLAEANKPKDDLIPDANPTPPGQPDANAAMTEQMAKAIVVQDTSHARFAEAKQFLENKSKGK